MKIEGMAAVVTGAGSGLGAATAGALARAGARVALFDLDDAAAVGVAERTGGFAVRCDVADAASVADALAAAAVRHGPARIVVHCAAISIGRVPLVGGDPAERLTKFARQLRINLDGALNVLSLAADAMRALAPLDDGERGVVVNTASVAAFEGQAGSAAYSASKGGIAALTLPAARELAPLGIRVNAIAPGIFDTAMIAGLPDYVRDLYLADCVFPKRFGAPDEFAELALAIVANRMLNGEVIRLDGAMRLPAAADFLHRAGVVAAPDAN
ncbi:SDR family NAD(P)-dependent oxidoreductase [Aromatoleum anaerobium]|uniref:SDR family NAD(P)-dependent oxidoreductase n=2 Tax=Aromatoleum TaxID=551759 RepID=A0ABX1PL18_9RHOO|nr:SDR family NAD(P)-dependent oxidoreductase [Aromatoleum anaerobium]MCK0506577.1 SDR family NAD(P)-dependent oxidoreductase [Aromatoleum anaerobium]